MGEWEVFYRDPDLVLRQMLENPDFDGQIDYAAYIGLDKTGKRYWSDFMSGNFAYRRSVSTSFIPISVSYQANDYTDHARPKYTTTIQAQRGLYIALSFSGATKQPCPWPLAMLNTIQYTF
jgi:hypothetical protein